MRIYVKKLYQEAWEFEVEPSDTIENLTLRVEDQRGIAANTQRLVFSGQQLDPQKTLADYNIKKDSTIHLVIRL